MRENRGRQNQKLVWCEKSTKTSKEFKQATASGKESKVGNMETVKIKERVKKVQISGMASGSPFAKRHALEMVVGQRPWATPRFS